MYLHDIIDQYMILSISTRYYRSVHDIIDQYMIVSISTRYYRSVHDMIKIECQLEGKVESDNPNRQNNTS
jgi:hypothetical protein